MRAAAKSRGDLHHLLLPGRQVTHETIDVQVRVDRREHGACLIAHARLGHEARAARHATERQVLGDGQVLAERELLVHHRDAGPKGLGWLRESNGRAVEQQRPLVGLDDAGEHFAERALAGAVLAAERVAGAGRDLHGDVLERDGAREPLGDVVKFDSRSHRQVRRQK